MPEAPQTAPGAARGGDAPPARATPPDATPPHAAPPGTPATASTDAIWARTAALDIWARLAALDYAGRDPYDALNTRLIPAALTKSRLVRRVLTQAVKRSPLPLQPLLAVKRQVDAYTLGHVLLAGARLRAGATPAGDASPGSAPTPAALHTACERVAAQLRALAVVDGEQIAWGYHFPVHTRFFSYVPPTPNLIVTAFAAKGMAAVTRAGLVDCTAEMRGAVAFILEGLPRVTDDTGQCIGYVPGETAVVHNANMLAALVLCEAAEVVGGAPEGGASAAAAVTSSWLHEALACARFTVARQAADGSWPYSEEPNGRWVDGFHTGFVLDGLAAVVRTTGDQSLRAALVRGLRFYVAQLFGPHGEPKYYPDHALPFDVLSAAQGVETLHVALRDGVLSADGASSQGDSAQAVPGQIDWIRRHLVKSGGKVAYQVHHRWTDRREFPRWSSAPLMSALAGVESPGAGAAPAEGLAPAQAAIAPPAGAAPAEGAPSEAAEACS